MSKIDGLGIKMLEGDQYFMDADTKYELLAKSIYERLIEEDGLTIEVQHDAKIQGKANEHQIDVYWEYQIAGIIHRVAIECKNYNSKVSIGKVRDFSGVLTDIGNINGIMISKKGFQKGAKDYASYYGINLKELRQPNDSDLEGKNYPITAVISLYQVDIKDRKFIIDKEWVLRNTDLLKRNSSSLPFRGRSDRIWITDNRGNRIKSLKEIENGLPTNCKKENGIQRASVFKDEYLETKEYGNLKLKAIVFTYDVIEQGPISLAMEGIWYAKAILKDVYTNEIKFFDKDNKIM